MSDIINTIENLLALRTWCRENLPTENSLVAYDLILFLAVSLGGHKKLSVKQIYSSLPHSYTAIRQHYNRLISDGWLEHKFDAQDRRIKYIEPTSKFIDTIQSYAKTAESIFTPPRFSPSFQPDC